MQPDSAALLWDVHAAATRVAGFIVGLDADAYAADELRRSAVERQLEIMMDFGVTVLHCTPSYALYLAETAKAKGVVDDQTLTEEQKAARLREIFRM